MTRTLVLMLGLLLISPAAHAKPTLGDEIESLQGNLEVRIDAIGPAPATKPEKKEQKKLVKAGELLKGWTGANDIPDLKLLGKAGKQILRSKTGDEAVWADVRDVVYRLIDLAKEKKGLGEDVLAKIYADRYKALVQKVLDKGQAHLDAAAELVEDDPVKAHKIVLKAWKTFLKSVLKGEKFEKKEEAALPDHLSIHRSLFTFALYNTANKDQFIRDVIFTGVWKSYTTNDEFPVEIASLAALWADPFVVHVEKNGGVTSWYGEAVLSRTEPGAPAQYLDLSNFLWGYKEYGLPGTSQLYFEGTIVVVVSNRHTPGSKGEQIYRIPHTFTSRVYD